jgi:hypothetical protein
MLFMVDWHKAYIAVCQLMDVIVLLRPTFLLLNSNDCTLANVTASGSRQWRHRGVFVQAMLALPVLVVIGVVPVCTSIGKKRKEAKKAEKEAAKKAEKDAAEQAAKDAASRAEKEAAKKTGKIASKAAKRGREEVRSTWRCCLLIGCVADLPPVYICTQGKQLFLLLQKSAPRHCVLCPLMCVCVVLIHACCAGGTQCYHHRQVNSPDEPWLVAAVHALIFAHGSFASVATRRLHSCACVSVAVLLSKQP